MMLANPGGLWALALIPLLLLLYVLRTQRRRMAMSSVRLWRGFGEELEARRQWRPPRPNWLLALQLAVVVLGSGALARPTLLQVTGGTHLVVVLDASASMGATDVPPHRFAEAQRLALGQLVALGPNDHATVIRAGASARVLAQAASPAQARAAIEQTSVGEAPGDLRTALLLANAAAELPAGAPRIVVYSDGAYAPPLLPQEPVAPVEFVPIGRRDDNVAVTALALRRPPSGGATTGFARVVNFGSAAVQVPARVLVDTLPREVRTLDLPPGAAATLTFTVPPGARTVAVQVDARDLLAADNRAEARTPGSGEHQVTVVSAQPDLLVRALRALPGVQVAAVRPEEYQGARLAPLVVFDGYLPPALPPTDVIVVNPPPGGPLPVRGTAAAPGVLGYDPTSPLLDAVEPAALQFGRLVRLDPPAWLTPVLWTSDGPALLEGTHEGRRVLVLAFDLRASNLPRLRAFPLLLANALDWLGWDDPGGTVRAGQPVRLPALAAGRIEQPGGGQALPPGAMAYAGTERVGRYVVPAARPGDPPAAEFRVGLLAPEESQLAPRAQPALAGTGPLAPLATPALALTGGLLLAVLGLHVAEWWWWAKRS
jgi:Ca-activated chloride channel family protein